MTIQETQHNEIIVLSVSGELMGGPEALELNEKMNQLLDDGRKKVVLDLHGLERMNSSGLGIMINALGNFKQNGGDLKLAALNPRIEHLLKVTRLTSIFEVYDTVSAAIASFS